MLESAPVSWLTSVDAAGRPHVTPLIGVWHDEALHFCTGRGEQKAVHLADNTNVSLTTGRNQLDAGTDVVVNGCAVPVTDRDGLAATAAAYVAKYGEEWRFDVADDGFVQGDDNRVMVMRVEMRRVFAFAKDPYGQTRYTWD